MAEGLTLDQYLEQRTWDKNKSGQSPLAHQKSTQQSTKMLTVSSKQAMALTKHSSDLNHFQSKLNQMLKDSEAESRTFNITNDKFSRNHSKLKSVKKRYKSIYHDPSTTMLHLNRSSSSF